MGVDVSTYYVPAIITLAVISATFQNLAMSVTIDREFGILKRGRGTPLPDWVFFAGRIGNSLVVSLADARPAGGDRPDRLRGRHPLGSGVRRSSLTLAVGASTFCCLGLALTGFIPSQSAAAPITNIAIFPLYFLSGVFIPESEIPNGVLQRRRRFPVTALLRGVLRRLDRKGRAARASNGRDLAVVAAWGLAGFLIGLRSFKWTPQAAG